MLHPTDTAGTPSVIRREAYAAPAYLVDTVDLSFDLDPAKTRVLNKMTAASQPRSSGTGAASGR